jgi:hypothetical protein
MDIEEFMMNFQVLECEAKLSLDQAQDIVSQIYDHKFRTGIKTFELNTYEKSIITSKRSGSHINSINKNIPGYGKLGYTCDIKGQ